MRENIRSWMTTKEFGDFIGYKPETIRKMIQQSRLRAGGQPHRIPIEQVERFGFSVEKAREFLDFEDVFKALQFQ